MDIVLHEEVEFYFCVPFVISGTNIPIIKDDRVQVFKNVSNNIRTSVFKWKEEPFISPIYFRDTREAFLLGGHTDHLGQLLENLIVSKDFPKFSSSLFANAVFYDYGVGAVVFRTRVSFNSFSEIESILEDSKKFAHQLIDEFFEQELIIASISEVGKKLLEYLPENPPKVVFGSEVTLRRLDDFCECAILKISSYPQQFYHAVNSKRLHEISKGIADYCGSAESDGLSGKPKVSGIVDYRVGLSGSVLVLDEGSANVPFDIFQALTFSVISLSLLEDTISRFRGISKSVAFNKDAIVAVEGNIEQFDKVSAILDSIHYDVFPANYIANSHEGLMFGEIWRGWQGEELLRSFERVIEDYRSIMSRIKEGMSRRISFRINLTMFIFTVISMGSFVAGVISLYDFNNNKFTSDDRLLMVGLAVFGFGFLAGCLTVSARGLWRGRPKMKLE